MCSYYATTPEFVFEQALSADTTKMQSPAWHGDALRDTEQRYKAGQEQPVDWTTAKRELRLHRE